MITLDVPYHVTRKQTGHKMINQVSSRNEHTEYMTKGKKVMELQKYKTFHT